MLSKVDHEGQETYLAGCGQDFASMVEASTTRSRILLLGALLLLSLFKHCGKQIEQI